MVVVVMIIVNSEAYVSLALSTLSSSVYMGVNYMFRNKQRLVHVQAFSCLLHVSRRRQIVVKSHHS